MVAFDTSLLLLLLWMFVGSLFRLGESWPAAKPSLVTCEKELLSPMVGGLDDTTGAEFPRAKTKSFSD